MTLRPGRQTRISTGIHLASLGIWFLAEIIVFFIGIGRVDAAAGIGERGSWAAMLNVMRPEGMLPAFVLTSAVLLVARIVGLLAASEYGRGQRTASSLALVILLTGIALYLGIEFGGNAYSTDPLREIVAFTAGIVFFTFSHAAGLFGVNDKKGRIAIAAGVLAITGGKVLLSLVCAFMEPGARWTWALIVAAPLAVLAGIILLIVGGARAIIWLSRNPGMSRTDAMEKRLAELTAAATALSAELTMQTARIEAASVHLRPGANHPAGPGPVAGTSKNAVSEKKAASRGAARDEPVPGGN